MGSATFSFVLATIVVLSAPSAFALKPDSTKSTTPNIPFLSLKMAADKALELNPQLSEKKEHISQMQDEVPITRAELLPNIKFTVNENREKDPLLYYFAQFSGNPYNHYQTELSVTQPLFAVGSLSAIHAAKIDGKLSTLDMQITQRDLLGEIIQAYFDVVMTTRNKHILRRQFKILNQSFRTAVHRARIGRSQILDALQAKTQLALLDSQIAEANSQYKVAVAQLANLIGEPKLKNFRMKNSLKVPSLSTIDKMINPSLQTDSYHLPELQENALNIEKVADEKAVTLGENLPSLEFVGDLENLSYKKSDLFSGAASAWSIGLQLNIPIFSGFSTLYQMRSYASQELQLETDRRNVENQATFLQVSARKTLESAERSILSGETALKLAQASSAEAQRNYRYATIDILQFLQVQDSYMQAESELNTYKYNYLVALQKYFTACGQPMMNLVDLLEEINK